AAEADVDALAAAGLFDALDVGLARSLADLAAATDPRLALAAALASRAVRLGDVCVDLPALAAGPVADDDGVALDGRSWPPADVWRAALAASRLVTIHGDHDEPRNARAGGMAPSPLVLDAAGRLYLHRYWAHETRLVDAILARAGAADRRLDDRALRDGLVALFGAATATPDAQLVAAWVAARRPLTVISGGPGTGKTTTVVRIAALLARQAIADGAPQPRIVLLAPTGKAAARLAEAVAAAGARLDLDDDVRAALPTDARTIHRALGLRGDGGHGRHGPDNPLDADVVVVDEASMVDLVLMRRLVDAVRPDARLILLGDHDQLASVDAGAVLGDLCGGDRAREAQARQARRCAAFLAGAASGGTGDVVNADDDAPMASAVVLLTHSHRFGSDSGIGRLARAINAGDADAALALLDDPRLDDVAREESAVSGARWTLASSLETAVLDGYGPVVRAADPGAQLDALAAFRVLCAHRQGPFGVEPLNARIVTALEDAAARIGRSAAVEAGTALRPIAPLPRAILVTRNDPALELYNGDVGVIAPAPGDGRPRAYFRAPDGALRDVSPARLPAIETAFALSIHKAQGSEFDRVAIVLPDAPSPLLTRELLYTAVTRARRHVTLFATADMLRLAIERRAKRASGLRERLWGAG
ncbi:MAG: exodeoxyribonuclease V subunit alpha, partial [Ardenticatenales bacterium]